MTKPRPRQIDMKEMRAMVNRAKKRELTEGDYELIGKMLDNLDVIREAVADDVDEDTLESLLRFMLGKKR